MTNFQKRLGVWTSQERPVSVVYPNDSLKMSAMDSNYIDDLSRSLLDSLPQGLKALKEDAGRNLQASLQAALARMNLVSREEFEVQARVLERSREALMAMEQRVRALEQQLAQGKD
jgi:BMFP domain-containing protein YqiC